MANSLNQRDFFDGMVSLIHGDALQCYARWTSPTVIVADGPYGLNSFPGDPVSPNGLAEWYEPHAKMWYERALPSATLWFWNSEQGWANCHRMLEDCGWEFRNCHIWDKGIGHIAGNCNTKTIRKFPVTTEVCVQYVRKNKLQSSGRLLSLRDWLRAEWERTGLPFHMTNEACGVRNAATRKYFTKDHLWYFPPGEAFQALVDYANQHGDPSGRPYFSRDGRHSMTGGAWELMRAKFTCGVGVSNVWQEPAVRGRERLKKAGSLSCVHMNQKPLKLLERLIVASSDPGDVVWEPFGGLCSVSFAAALCGRRAFAAEINELFFAQSIERFLEHENQNSLFLKKNTSASTTARTRNNVGTPGFVESGS